MWRRQGRWPVLTPDTSSLVLPRHGRRHEEAGAAAVLLSNAKRTLQQAPASGVYTTHGSRSDERAASEALWPAWAFAAHINAFIRGQ